MMDLDELKLINDRFGHFHGDRVLRSVGDVIRSSTRRIDTTARYGGDEFVVLLPETDPTGAWVLAEKIRLGVGELAFEVAGTVLKTSLSVGVVTHPDDGTTADDLIDPRRRGDVRVQARGQGPASWASRPGVRAWKPSTRSRRALAAHRPDTPRPGSAGPPNRSEGHDGTPV